GSTRVEALATRHDPAELRTIRGQPRPGASTVARSIELLRQDEEHGAVASDEPRFAAIEKWRLSLFPRAPFVRRREESGPVEDRDKNIVDDRHVPSPEVRARRLRDRAGRDTLAVRHVHRAGR